MRHRTFRRANYSLCPRPSPPPVLGPPDNRYRDPFQGKTTGHNLTSPPRGPWSSTDTTSYGRNWLWNDGRWLRDDGRRGRWRGAVNVRRPRDKTRADRYDIIIHTYTLIGYTDFRVLPRVGTNELSPIPSVPGFETETRIYRLRFATVRTPDFCQYGDVFGADPGSNQLQNIP